MSLGAYKRLNKIVVQTEQAYCIMLDVLLGHGAEHLSLSKPGVEEAAVVQARPIPDVLTLLILATVIGSKFST